MVSDNGVKSGGNMLNKIVKSKYYPFLPIIFCSIICYILILGGNNMDLSKLDVNVVALVVALIGVAGSIFVAVYTFKKDSHAISNVKSDTSEMKPLINNMHEIVKKDHDLILGTIKEKISYISNSVNLINELHNEMKIQRRIKDSVSIKLESPDYLIGGITKLYEENMALTQRVKELTLENDELKHEIILYKEQIKIEERNQERGYER